MEFFPWTALRNVRAAVLLSLWCLALAATSSVYAQTSSDIVLYATETFAKSGNWRTEADSTAAGGNRMRYPDGGLAKINTPLANPTHYFDLTFNAEQGKPYRLWMRGKADANSTNNDSAYVQFSGSVDLFGTPVYRIGTTSATMFNLEECTGCGLNAWGWNDNLFAGLGPLIYFATTGPQTIRVQLREDGLSLDQIVLSPVTWQNFAPGWTKNDSVILLKNSGATAAPSNIVLWAADVPTTSIRGSWVRSADSSAAGQISLSYPDFGNPKVTTAIANPAQYFDISFSASAGVPYRLWMRAKAFGNSTNNDSVWVQFSSSLNQSGAADYRIGTTSAIMYNMEECTGCGLSNWGWNDTGINGLGPIISFATNGTQTLRVQLREDGINIDQIVLSPQTYITNSPGAFKNDTVIMPRSGEAAAAPAPSPTPTPTPTPTPVPNQIPQVSLTVSTTSGSAPLTVAFNSTASDPDGWIVAYSWTFGDGQSSTAANPSHTYQSTGSFSARVTVTDNAGATASAAVTINVSSPPPASGARFKVLHWNVAYGRGTDNIIDLNRQATWLANSQAELISLNEVPTANIQAYIDLLRQKTGVTWYSHWVPIQPGDGVGQQILSRYPFVSTGHRYLSFSRSVTHVTVSIGGRTIQVFSTHLSPDSASWRTTQINEMNSYMAGFPEQRIAVGDYNLSPNWAEYGTMTASYYDSWQQAFNAGTAFSYPDNPEGRTRKGRIDYINYSKGATGLRLVEVRMPDQRDLNNRNVVITVGNSNDWGVRPSDHNFFVTTFEIK